MDVTKDPAPDILADLYALELSMEQEEGRAIRQAEPGIGIAIQSRTVATAAAEITRLRAALDETRGLLDGANADADNWHQKCVEAEAERDAARAKGLEDAAAKCLTHPMRFAGQMEDHVRTTLALAISAMKEPTK